MNYIALWNTFTVSQKLLLELKEPAVLEQINSAELKNYIQHLPIRKFSLPIFSIIAHLIADLGVVIFILRTRTPDTKNDAKSND